jgi:hypothetical protein
MMLWASGISLYFLESNWTDSSSMLERRKLPQTSPCQILALFRTVDLHFLPRIEWSTWGMFRELVIGWLLPLQVRGLISTTWTNSYWWNLTTVRPATNPKLWAVQTANICFWKIASRRLQTALVSCGLATEKLEDDFGCRKKTADCLTGVFSLQSSFLTTDHCLLSCDCG